MTAALAFARECIDRIPLREFRCADPVRNLWYDRREKGYTAMYPLIGVNTSQWMNVVAIDIDADWTRQGVNESMIRCLDAVKPPNLVSVNPENGHAHASWWLKRPANRNGSRKVRELSEEVVVRVRQSVQGDTDFNNLLVKNPLSWDYKTNSYYWQTHLLRTELYDFEELLELPKVEYVETDLREDSETALIGRNCHLHECVSIRACANAHLNPDRNTIFGWLVEMNISLYPNNLLGDSELHWIAISVEKFLRYKYTGRHRLHLWEGRKPVMTFTGDLSPQERRLAGTRFVHELRRTRTDKAIREARQSLANDGSQSRVAALTGFSLSTVKRYWSQTDSVSSMLLCDSDL
jgi:hypothetical protein